VLGVRAQIGAAQVDEVTLTQKLSVLQTVSPTAATGANVVVSAVPDANPALAVISQLKILASGNGIILSAIKVATGAVNPSGLNNVDISFTAVGTRLQIFSFLEATAQIAPITIADKVRMAESAGAVRADISVKSYWADFPKTIPSVTQPITDLTPPERETLAKTSALTQPTFLQVSPSQGNVNPNPFGQ